MQVVRDPYSFISQKPLHMAIGMFDGVHIGHQAVIESAIHVAQTKGDMSAVLTFTPHPSQILHPKAPTLLLQTEEQKEERLRAIGIDILAWQSFNMELAAVPADQFVQNLKARFPSLSSIYVGENFRFGKGREGNIATMLTTALEQGVHVISIERVRYDGEPVSSTRIRSLLVEGDIESTNVLLGYKYYCTGEVLPGKRLGHTIGFPTLNVRWEPQCCPRYGVYAARVRRADDVDGPGLPGIANYGLRPTVDNNAAFPLLETHLLSPCPFGTGDRLRIEWLHFLRPEQKFDGLAALKSQISKDCAQARELLQTEHTLSSPSK